MGKWLNLARRAPSQALQPRVELAGVGSTRRPSPNGYAWRVGNVLREISRADYPAGLIPWLEQAYPRLYTELTSRLPDDIHRLAKALAPFDEFERVLNRWLDAHREAGALYPSHLSVPKRANRRAPEQGGEPQP